MCGEAITWEQCNFLAILCMSAPAQLWNKLYDGTLETE